MATNSNQPKLSAEITENEEKREEDQVGPGEMAQQPKEDVSKMSHDEQDAYFAEGLQLGSGLTL